MTGKGAQEIFLRGKKRAMDITSHFIKKIL